jgi:hypothetical protein
MLLRIQQFKGRRYGCSSSRSGDEGARRLKHFHDKTEADLFAASLRTNGWELVLSTQDRSPAMTRRLARVTGMLADVPGIVGLS